MNNIDMSSALVSADKIIKVINEKFPNFSQYAATHTTYATNKRCKNLKKEVLNYLFKIGYITKPSIS